ncbi:hypothetical protein [Methylotuvimicrobium buryatense]|uniref:Uncharacterized protein n=1 Tax=Methylotuvimicrobium buryatense TaxID=95641 RepID=A0A4P9UQZ0_METBY|nr:hypothetical protein [Methylotuvimicrobium buryatense]QCW82970.1 hypothetical protein EQU24_12520 [Methylotuvimicrobium buryatense]
MQELIADTIKQRARKAATYSTSAGKEEPFQSAGEWDVFFERFSRPVVDESPCTREEIYAGRCIDSTIGSQ